MPANYAISFSASAYSRLGDEGSPITDLKNATALGCTMRIRGDRLKNGVGDQPFMQLCAGYLELHTNGTSGNVFFTMLGVGLTQGSTDPPVAQTSIDDVGYYTIRAWRDNAASPTFAIEIFKPDDTLWDSATASPVATITNGVYGDFSLNFSGGNGASADPLVCDWAAAWDRIPPGQGSAPSEPTGVEAGLLHWHKWDENGGTIGDDQQSATDAVLTGTYAWILLSGGPSSPMFRGS